MQYVFVHLCCIFIHVSLCVCKALGAHSGLGAKLLLFLNEFLKVVLQAVTILIFTSIHTQQNNSMQHNYFEFLKLQTYYHYVTSISYPKSHSFNG